MLLVFDYILSSFMLSCSYQFRHSFLTLKSSLLFIITDFGAA